MRPSHRLEKHVPKMRTARGRSSGCRYIAVPWEGAADKERYVRPMMKRPTGTRKLVSLVRQASTYSIAWCRLLIHRFPRRLFCSCLWKRPQSRPEQPRATTDRQTTHPWRNVPWRPRPLSCWSCRLRGALFAYQSNRMTDRSYQCVDVQSNLESCGGCITARKIGDGRSAGVDCTALPHVDAVACLNGECVIGTSYLWCLRTTTDSVLHHPLTVRTCTVDAPGITEKCSAGTAVNAIRKACVAI